MKSSKVIILTIILSLIYGVTVFLNYQMYPAYLESMLKEANALPMLLGSLLLLILAGAALGFLLGVLNLASKKTGITISLILIIILLMLVLLCHVSDFYSPNIYLFIMENSGYLYIFIGAIAAMALFKGLKKIKE